MKPIVMRDHSGPVTFLRYNSNGDLLFSCAKDNTPIVWFADNGEKLGTYTGHKGTVWCCDASRDSKRLITASADKSVKLWHLQTGAPVYTFIFRTPARSVDFSDGDDFVVVTTDPSDKIPSAIHVKRIATDPSKQTGESVINIACNQGRINRAVWGPLNKTIISAGEDSVIRIWDTETGRLITESDKVSSHTKEITWLSKSRDGSQFLTSSSDKTAKLWDIKTLTLIKTYKDDQAVNAVAISPLLDHVVMGGIAVTNDQWFGKSESKFFHKVSGEKIGLVKGHLGPINALAFNPDGTSFSSGGEDGYVRLHHFGEDYFDVKM